jgi:hypothetical protein
MGLKGDLHEVATVWKQSSWRIKVYLALSVFLASGSIASLSETVFRWKGFINDAVAFYKKYVADQLQELLELVLTRVPEGLSHFLILSTIYFAANLRVANFALPGARARSVAASATINYIGTALGIGIIFYFTHRQTDGDGAIGLFIGSAFGASVSYWRVGGAARVLWFASLIGPFALVGIAAAVSSGLLRTE